MTLAAFLALLAGDLVTTSIALRMGATEGNRYARNRWVRLGLHVLAAACCALAWGVLGWVRWVLIAAYVAAVGNNVRVIWRLRRHPLPACQR